MSITPLTHPEARRYRMWVHGHDESVYSRRRRERREWLQSRGQGSPSWSRITNVDNLIDVYGLMRDKAGQSPGPDGLSYADLGRSEIAAVLRQVSQAIKAGTYRPYGSRAVRVPKRNGQGHRTLRLRGIIDRVVEEAIHLELSPFMDRVFLEQSFGFRAGRNVWDMLAYLECQMIDLNCWVIVTDDVRNAFDNVRLAPLAEWHRRHLGEIIGNCRLLDVLDRVLRGGDRPDREVGIDQGGPYSPTALNLFLHHAHDLGIDRDPTIPAWARYADNVAYLTQDVPAGRQARATAAAWLEATGLRLKGSNGPPVDLRNSEQAELLGFTLKRSPDGTGLSFSLGTDAWEGLRRGLANCHNAGDPQTTAQQLVQGWMAWCGPACEMTERPEIVEMILLQGAELGFRELGSPAAIAAGLESSHLRWLQCRARIGERLRDHMGRHGGTSSTPVPASLTDSGA